MVQVTMVRAQQNNGVTESKERPARIGKTDIKLETADYITEIVGELRSLARGAELKALSEVLELAYYEAYSITNKVQTPPAVAKRIKALEQRGKDLA